MSYYLFSRTSGMAYSYGSVTDPHQSTNVPYLFVDVRVVIRSCGWAIVVSYVVVTRLLFPVKYR